MPDLLACPNCQKLEYEPTLSRCHACGFLGTSDTTVDQAALIGLLYNVRVRLRDMEPHEFQQIIGMFSPPIDEPEEDGVAFTADTAAMAHRYLSEHGILCIQIAETANRQTAYSLVV